MDSGACADLSDKPKDESIGTVKVNNDVSPEAKLLKNDSVPPNTKLLPAAPECLVPITPDTIRENGDFPIDFHSPLTVVRKQLKLASIDSEGNANGSAFVDNDDDATPQTPKDAVFDPFAPGPDNMARARAPRYKKYLDELRISVARRIDFDPSFDDAIQPQNSLQYAESLSDQDMFESVYESLLQVIVSKQTEGFLAQMSNVEYAEDDCKTPAFPLRITGISDTCPAAPVKMKPGGKLRNIQVGLCKKLEF